MELWTWPRQKEGRHVTAETEIIGQKRLPVLPGRIVINVETQKEPLREENKNKNKNEDKFRSSENDNDPLINCPRILHLQKEDIIM